MLSFEQRKWGALKCSEVLGMLEGIKYLNLSSHERQGYHSSYLSRVACYIIDGASDSDCSDTNSQN